MSRKIDVDEKKAANLYSTLDVTKAVVEFLEEVCQYSCSVRIAVGASTTWDPPEPEMVKLPSPTSISRLFGSYVCSIRLEVPG